MRYRNATFLFNLNKRRIFRKPTLNGLYTPFGSPVSGQKPSLPLRKAPPFSPSLSSIVFTTPSVPLIGDRNPQGREDVTALRCCICPTCPSPTGGSLTHSQALRCSEPLRFMVVGPSKVCARFYGLGPHEEWCLISNHDVCNA